MKEHKYTARTGFQKQYWSAADVSLVFQKFLSEVVRQSFSIQSDSSFVSVNKVYPGVMSELPVLNRKWLQTTFTAIVKKSTLPPERTDLDAMNVLYWTG